MCPVPYLALAKATPWGLYFTGLSRYGEGFARDLGHLFEQYIGRQLRLLPGAQVLGEVSYGPNQRPVIPAWRWRVLHSPSDAPRFMLTDRGWIYVGMEDWPTHGLLLPMGPRVAILGYLDDPGLPSAPPPFEEYLYLCPSTVT